MSASSIYSTGLEGDRAYCIDVYGSGELEYVCEKVALVKWREVAGEERKIMEGAFVQGSSSWWLDAMLEEISVGMINQTHNDILRKEGIDHAIN